MRISSEDKALYQTLQFIKFELLWVSSFYTISSVATAFAAGRRVSVGMLGFMNGCSGRDG